MGELLFNALMLLVMIAMTIYSGQIVIWQGYVGARYWPMTLLVIAVIIFFFKTIAVYKNLPKEERKFKFDFSVFKDQSTQRLLLSFLITILYAALLSTLGFFISTVLYAAMLSRILGLKNIFKLALSSLGITLAIYAIFVWSLDIMVPRGAGPLYYFGLWLETLF
ncbi:MAG: tripartite tricarboxylate transporter TctB family protein [Pygmaiobacter sp.]